MVGTGTGQGSGGDVQRGGLPPSPEVNLATQHEFMPSQSNSEALLHATSRPQSLPSSNTSTPVPTVRSQGSLLQTETSVSASTDAAKTQEKEKVAVVHVREGSEYKAMLFLLRSVSRHFKLDDILPEVPDHIASSRYHLLQPPDKLKNGDADGFLMRSTHPRGLLVSRRSAQNNHSCSSIPLSTHASVTHHNPDSRGNLGLMYGGVVRGQFQDMATLHRTTQPASPGTQLTRQSQLVASNQHLPTQPSASIETSQSTSVHYVIPNASIPFGHVVRQSSRQIRAWRRLQALVKLANPPSRSILVPVAMPANPGYLKMAADAIILFNSKGLSLTPYLEVTCMSAAAAARIQAAFRAHRARKQLNLPVLLLRTRAARVIQRCWKSYLLRKRCCFLDQLAAQSQMLEGLMLGDRLALTVHAADTLKKLLIKRARVFPEHRLEFTFSPQNRVYQVVNLDVPRPGLPAWTKAAKTVLRPAEVAAQFGSRPMFGQAQMMELLTRGAVWKDASGAEIPQTGGIPQPSESSQPGDVLLQIAFVNLTEAKARAALFFALTWDPISMSGVGLAPPHLTTMAQTMPPTASESGASASSGLAMHKWASLNSHLTTSSAQYHASPDSLPASAVHSLVSNSGLPDWYTPVSLSPRQSFLRSPLGGSGYMSPPVRSCSPPHALQSRHSSTQVRSRERSISPAGNQGGIMGHIKIPRRHQSTLDKHDSFASDADDAQGGESIWPSAPPAALKTSQSARMPDKPDALPAPATGQPDQQVKPRQRGKPAAMPPILASQEFEFRPATAQALLQPHIFPALPLAPEVTDESVAHRPTTAAAILQSMSDALSAQPVVPALQLQSASGSSDSSAAGSARAPLPNARPPSASEAAAISRRGSLLGSSRRNSAGSGGHTGSDAGSVGQKSARVSKTGTDADVFQSQSHHFPPRPPVHKPSSVAADKPAISDPSGIGPWQAQTPAPDSRPVPLLQSAQQVDQPALQNPIPQLLVKGAEELAHVVAAKTHHHHQQDQQQQHHHHHQGDRQHHSPVTESRPMSYNSTPRGGSVAPEGDTPVPPALLEIHELGQEPEPPAPATSDAVAPQEQPAQLSGIAEDAPAEQGHHQMQADPSVGGSKASHGLAGPATAFMAPPRQPHTVTWLSATVQLDVSGDQPGMASAGPTGAVPMLQSGVVQERGMPWEQDPEKQAKKRVSRAQALQQQFLYTGGPATIAATMPGRHLPGACLLPAEALNLQVSDSALSPGRAAGTKSPSKQHDAQHAPADEAGLLVVTQAPIQDVYMPDLLDELQTTQAMLQRDQGYATEDLLTRIRDANFINQRTKCITARGPHVVWIKHYETGHCLAPNYVPMTTQAMSELLAGMKAVYQAAATEQVQALRQEHKMIANEIAIDKQQIQQAVKVTAARQKEVVQTMQRVFKEEWDQAAGNRAVSRTMAVNRQKRKEHERAFAQAFARQVVGLLGRNIQKGERTMLRMRLDDETAQLTAMHRADRSTREENIATSKAGAQAMNMWRANLVRSTGFSEEVKAYEEAAQAYQRDVVTLRRLEGVERRQRVGPPGGVWGSQPKESLRQALPLSSVVSAAEAKRQRKLQTSRKHKHADSGSSAVQQDSAEQGTTAAAGTSASAADASAAQPAGSRQQTSFLPPIPRPSLGPEGAAAQKKAGMRLPSASHHSNASRPVSGTSASWTATGSYTATGSEFTDDSEFESDTGGAKSRSGLSMRVCAQSEGGAETVSQFPRLGTNGAADDELQSSSQYDSDADEGWVGCVLPELPYAQGARLLSPGKPRRPAGILV